MKRKIITIDAAKCTGCGHCIPNCPEGAIRIIDNKARLVSDRFCDGLGACLGHCPEGAIAIEERAAVPYDERTVMKNIITQGRGVIEAHLQHLHDHSEREHLDAALDVLKEHGISVPADVMRPIVSHKHDGGCPGARSFEFGEPTSASDNERTAEGEPLPSQLRHWPVQMHLISPAAHHYRGTRLLLAADCSAYCLGDFHRTLLKGKTLAIACPKLDQGKEVYLEKLRALIDEAMIATLTVVIMEVPCCGGLLQLAKQALAQSKRTVPIKVITVSVDGRILREEQG